MSRSLDPWVWIAYPTRSHLTATDRDANGAICILLRRSRGTYWTLCGHSPRIGTSATLMRADSAPECGHCFRLWTATVTEDERKTTP